MVEIGPIFGPDHERERAGQQAMYEELLRASRAAYREERAYRRLLMVRAVELSHPSIRLTQVYVSGPTPAEDSWGVACLWPQPHVGSGDAGPRAERAVRPDRPGAERERVGAVAVDSRPSGDPGRGSGGHGDHRSPEAGAPAAGVSWRLIGGRSLAKMEAMRQFEAEHQLAVMLGIEAERQTMHRQVMMRGARLDRAWLDEAVTWKTGRSIESYMDEVIREVMGE